MKSVSHLRPAIKLEGVRIDNQELSDLISLVYDAAIDQSLWQKAIEKVAHLVGGVGAGLFWKDVDAQHVSTSHRFGIAWPLPVALFRQIYPAAVGHFLAEIEQPVATADLMPHDEFVKSDLYREWARPQGLSTSSAPFSTNRQRAWPCSGCSATNATAWLTTKRAAASG
jgi:hypothetical protein